MATNLQKTDKKGAPYQREASIIDELNERAAINMLLNGGAYHPDAALLTPECFETPLARALYEAIRELTDMGQAVNVSTVWTRLGEKGETRVDINSLLELAKEPLGYDLDNKVCTLRDLAIRRRLLALSRELGMVAVSRDRDVSAGVGKVMERLAHIEETAPTDVKTIGETVEELVRQVERNLSGEGDTFSRSGFEGIDRNAMLRPEALTVIAAHSAHGKSALALTMAYNVAAAGQGVAYYSLEMSSQELTERVVASLCDVEPVTLHCGTRFQDGLIEKLEKAQGKLADMPIYFDEMASHSIDTLVVSIRQMARSKKVVGVVVDYLQILVQTLDRGKYQTEESALGSIVRTLKNVAKEERIWILLLSQLNRNHDQDEPQESDLRGSGQILETADNCLLLWRPEKTGLRYRGELSAVDTHGTAQLRVAKARLGGDGERFILRFVADRAHFEQLEGDLPIAPALPNHAGSAPEYKRPRKYKQKAQRTEKKTLAPQSLQLPFPAGGETAVPDADSSTPTR